jgi:tetratricopeptide (TPR) repeat protein
VNAPSRRSLLRALIASASILGAVAVLWAAAPARAQTADPAVAPVEVTATEATAVPARQAPAPEPAGAATPVVTESAPAPTAPPAAGAPVPVAEFPKPAAEPTPAVTTPPAAAAPARSPAPEPPAARPSPSRAKAPAPPPARPSAAARAAPTPAPEPASAPPQIATAPASPPADIATAWRRVRDLAEGTGPEADLDAAVTTLAAARDAGGLDNLETAAQALAGWAYGAVADGDSARAERLSRAAVRLAPGAPEGHLVRARMYWAEGRYPAAAAWALRGGAVGLAHPWVGLAWAGYLVIVFWMAAATALVVLIVPSLAKALRTFHHQVREYAAFRVPSFFVTAAALALVALPVAGGWGLGWTIVAWTLLAWAGDPARGRRAHLFLLLVVLLGPWLCAPLLAPSEPPGAVVAMALEEGSGAASAEGTPAPEPPADAPAAEDWRVAFALGNAALRNGAYDEAIAWYEAARREGGDAVRLTHNVATAEFRAGRFAEAERSFQALADSGHAPARTLFNLGQAQSRRLDFDAARATFERARQADAGDYLRASRMTGAGDEVAVVPFGVTRADLRAMTLEHGGAWSEFAAPLWRYLFGSLSMALAPVLMAALAALAWLLPALVTSRHVYPCDVCRASVCQDCMQFIYDTHLCRRCVEQLAGTRGTLADVNMLRARRRPLARPALHLAERLVPGLMDLRRGRYGRASFQLLLLAFVLWGVALLGTIPAWAVSVPMEGWPVTRLAGALLVLLQVAWTLYATAERPVTGPAAERPKQARRVNIDAAHR